MRALFLDFDGVFHRAGNGVENTGPTFVWLPLLAEALVGHDDVVVVVHSTWRYQYSLSELRELLASLGARTIAAVPRGPRAEAIRWFLQMNPGLTDFRVLDDEAGEFVPPPPELLLCDPAMGLSTPGVLDALRQWLAATRERST